MDVDHLAAEDSDEGGLTGECRQVVLCLQLQEIYVQFCCCALRRCAEGMSCAAGSLTKTKLLQGIGCPEVVPPFHMAAGSEQEEEDLIEHSDPSGRPGPIQSGEGAHHLHFCQTDANALVKARPAGNLQSQNARLSVNAGVSEVLAKVLPVPFWHQRPQLHCRAKRPIRGPSLEDQKRLAEMHLVSHDECLYVPCRGRRPDQRLATGE